jgi:hypothetical protein
MLGDQGCNNHLQYRRLDILVSAFPILDTRLLIFHVPRLYLGINDPDSK